jgi:hypothetical protein
MRQNSIDKGEGYFTSLSFVKHKGGAHMPDQMQLATVVPSLSSLLEHPEFQRGIVEAQEYFSESYEDAPLTEEEMIEEVEMSVSRRVTETSRTLCRMYGWAPSSYLYNLGYVVGIIDKGLTYAHGAQE